MPEPTGNDQADVQAMVRLHRAGWSIGDVVAWGEDGRPARIVSGANGKNLIRVEGSSPAEAWGRAVEEARRLRMLGRTDRPYG